MVRYVTIVVALAVASGFCLSRPWKAERDPPRRAEPEDDEAKPAPPVLRGLSATRRMNPTLASVPRSREEKSTASLLSRQQVVGRILAVERGPPTPLAHRWLAISCVRFYIRCGMGMRAVYHTSTCVTDNDGRFHASVPAPAEGCVSGVIVQCHPTHDDSTPVVPLGQGQLPRPPWFPFSHVAAGWYRTPSIDQDDATRFACAPAFDLRRSGSDAVIGWTPMHGVDDRFRCTWNLTENAKGASGNP